MKISRLKQFLILVLIVYGIFKIPGVFGQPIPGSLIIMYMFFAVATILLVMTSTGRGARELFAPIKGLVEAPGRSLKRNVIFAIVPLVAAFLTYDRIKPGFDAPVELRSTHPAPPSVFKAYGKTFNMTTMENPYRRLEKENTEKFKEFVREGGTIYFKSCFFCHGDKLDGKGHFGYGFSPLPLPFQGKDTIAQLQESYVFWRVATGGPGLPKESTPWMSAMPVWHNFLTEDNIWKVVLFIYDYTGNAPRSWEK